MNNNKSILVVTDDPRFNSGVANQARHVVKDLYRKGYNVFVVGVSNIQNPNPGELFTWESGEMCVIFQSSKYDDMNLIREIINKEKIECLVLFTDPHRYMGVWTEAQSLDIPIYYIHVWDSYLVGGGKSHFNLPIYENCSGIGCISRQTEWFVNRVFADLRPDAGQKPFIHYVGHGSNPEVFRPLPPNDPKLAEFRRHLMGDNELDFIVLMANRNQGRKKFSDLIEAFNLFCEELPKEEADKCGLILHTEAISDAGTNLIECARALAPNRKVFLTNRKFEEADLNLLYNLADVVCNVSNAEGFGLTCNEGMLAGKPVIATATGGLVDQIGFFGTGGERIPWTPQNKSQLREFSHGSWAFPVFPNRTIIGSPLTPYLYDENAPIEGIVQGLQWWKSMRVEDRMHMGLQGRSFAINMGLTAENFANSVTAGIETTINNFQPKSKFSVFSV